MESSAKIGNFLLEGHGSTFLGQKHKSAIWDRTPPTYTSNLVYMCAGGFRVPNLQTELNYLDSFKFYCIFSNCKWPPPWIASMFIMFNMHVHVCVHAYVCLHRALHIPTPTHTPIYLPHLPPRGVTPQIS